MARTMGARPSVLMGISNDYEAWCVDEAVFYYQTLLGSGRKLAPKRTEDNSAIIAQLMNQ